MVETKIGIMKKGQRRKKQFFYLYFLQISSTVENLVHPLSESEGINIRVERKEDKPTIMMLMKNLVPVRDLYCSINYPV